jgi:hypothetical protein
VKRALTIGITSVALAATLPVVTARGQVPPVTQPNVYAPRYDFGPRIIHVPQPGEDDDDVASAPNVRRVMPDEDDDIEEPAAPPRKPKTSAAPAASRRKPYNVATPRPAAVNERRAVLSAPLHDGPSPVRPTPRFVKETGVKFPPAPPPGYTPPSNLPHEAAPPQEPAPQEPEAEGAPSSE